MHWWAQGHEDALTDLSRRFSGASWPEPPDGLSPVGKRRAMRLVLTGRLPRSDGASRSVYVKWSRPVTRTDRVRRRFLGGRGPREGRVLRVLAERGIPVPRVLGYGDDGADFLVTEAVPGFRPMTTADAADRLLVVRVSRLLAGAHRAGLRHRDLHLGNLGVADGRPVLVDVGGASIRRGRGSELAALARAHHGLLGDATRTQRLRALRAWTRERGRSLDRRGLHALARRVERRARRVTSRYRRGRDRRATRSGRHYDVRRLSNGVRVVQARDAPALKAETIAAWLLGPPATAPSLKSGGGVRRVALERDVGSGVWKRYAGRRSLWLPRAFRAFRLAVALEHRGVAVPSPWLAAADARGDGFLWSAFVEGKDLHRFTEGGREGDLAALEPRARRALAVTLGRFLRRMHDEGITHRDLKAPNLLVAQDGPAGFRIVVADVDGARRRHPSWRRRARDLARLDASLGATRADRGRVFRAYFGAPPALPVDPRAFLTRVHRHVRAKRGPGGVPR